MNTLLWFQRDLRLHDNPSLEWAIQRGKPIIAVYIYSPEEDAPWSEGGASRWWLHHSLIKLSAGLAELNIKLHCFNGNSTEIIDNLVTHASINAIAWTNRSEPHRRAVENTIETNTARHQVSVKRFNNYILAEPDEFLTIHKQTPYKVFTPFYKKLRSEIDVTEYCNTYSINTDQLPAAITSIKNSLTVDELQLLDSNPWHSKLHRYWMPGETSAQDQLASFLDHSISDYISQRDIPAIDGTSKLSAHLHFGEISPQQILRELSPLIENVDGKTAGPAEGYLRQLIWREFARYILWHFPFTTDKPMNKNFDSKFWKNQSPDLEKWQRGETGIAIVDAGMKQLWETGSMHNRVRMLTASLLTKNMGIAWQQGAHWFWDTLIDADLANNTMGWQWVAGCGVDAAPYFRIFNPDTQARRFDPMNNYIKRWLKNTQPVNEPIVNLGSSRQHALDRYQAHIKH